VRNKFGIATLATALGFTAIAPVLGSAEAPPVWSVTIAGRPIDAHGEYALYRDGTVSVNLVDFARALGGVIIYRTANGAEVSLNNKHLTFTTGLRSAKLDDVPVALSSAPFVRGDQFYVPLRTLALTAGFHVAFDRAHTQIHLSLPQVSVSPTPLASQIVLAAAGSIASDGLHLTATAANLTGAPLNVVFPTSARVAFTASRDGRVIWNSISGTRALETKSSLMFTGNAAKSFAGFWPGFLSAGPGMIHIRAELLSTPPVFAPSFDVAGVPYPTPSPTLSAAASAAPGAKAGSTASAPPAPNATSAAEPDFTPAPTPTPAPRKHHYFRI
jgi:hypothetical protein